MFHILCGHFFLLTAVDAMTAPGWGGASGLVVVTVTACDGTCRVGETLTPVDLISPQFRLSNTHGQGSQSNYLRTMPQ
jgi:hypothetical protein